MFAMMRTRGQIVVVQTAVRNNFEIAPSLTEAFTLWRGVFAPLTD